MTNVATRSAIALLAAATMAACSSDTSTAPASSTLDLSAAISEMSSGTVGGLPGLGSFLSLPTTFTLPTVLPAACTYSASTQGFGCPPVTAGGLTFNVSYFLKDASGNAQTQPSLATTASLRAIADTHGTVSAPATPGTSVTVALTDHSDMTLSGLLAANRVLNGTSVSHYDATSTGVTSAHSLVDVNTTTTSVVLPPESSVTRYPLSGTVATDVTAVTSISVLPSVTTTAHALVTFNGTSTPTLVLTVLGVTHTCHLDLTGQTAPVSC